MIEWGPPFLITTWEFVDYDSLAAFEPFYTYVSDVISLFTVTISMLRLPTYCLCDVAFRTEIKSMIQSSFRKSEDGKTVQIQRASEISLNAVNTSNTLSLL